MFLLLRVAPAVYGVLVAGFTIAWILREVANPNTRLIDLIGPTPITSMPLILAFLWGLLSVALDVIASVDAVWADHKAEPPAERNKFIMSRVTTVASGGFVKLGSLLATLYVSFLVVVNTSRKVPEAESILLVGSGTVMEGPVNQILKNPPGSWLATSCAGLKYDRMPLGSLQSLEAIAAFTSAESSSNRSPVSVSSTRLGPKQDPAYNSRHYVEIFLGVDDVVLATHRSVQVESTTKAKLIDSLTKEGVTLDGFAAKPPSTQNIKGEPIQFVIPRGCRDSVGNITSGTCWEMWSKLLRCSAISAKLMNERSGSSLESIGKDLQSHTGAIGITSRSVVEQTASDYQIKIVKVEDSDNGESVFSRGMWAYMPVDLDPKSPTGFVVRDARPIDCMFRHFGEEKTTSLTHAVLGEAKNSPDISKAIADQVEWLLRPNTQKGGSIYKVDYISPDNSGSIFRVNFESALVKVWRIPPEIYEKREPPDCSRGGQ